MERYDRLTTHWKSWKPQCAMQKNKLNIDQTPLEMEDIFVNKSQLASKPFKLKHAGQVIAHSS